MLFRSLKEIGISAGPIILGLILGPIAEINLRGALEISGGSYLIFVEKPISLIILVITLALLAFPFARTWYINKKTNIAVKIDSI